MNASAASVSIMVFILFQSPPLGLFSAGIG